MASLTIRRLDEKTKALLRIQAAHHGRSMEEEAREILRAALTSNRQPALDLADSIKRRFARFGGVELELPKRQQIPAPPKLET